MLNCITKQKLWWHCNCNWDSQRPNILIFFFQACWIWNKVVMCILSQSSWIPFYFCFLCLSASLSWHTPQIWSSQSLDFWDIMSPHLLDWPLFFFFTSAACLSHICILSFTQESQLSHTWEKLTLLVFSDAEVRVIIMALICQNDKIKFTAYERQQILMLCGNKRSWVGTV